MSRASKRQRKEEAKARRAEERRKQGRRRSVKRVGLIAALVLLGGTGGYWAYGRMTAPVTWPPCVRTARTSASSRTRAPRSRAARAKPWAVSAGLQ